MNSSDSLRIAQAIDLAHTWVEAAQRLTPPRAKQRQKRLVRLLSDRKSLDATMAITDRVLRISSPARKGQMFRDTVQRAGSLDGFTPVDELLMRAGSAATRVMPKTVMRLVEARVRTESNGIILDADPARLHRHLETRRAGKMASNINVLGEAILGEREAKRRQASIVRCLRDDQVNYVSVKISAVVSQLDVFAFDHEVDRISARLREIYRVAMEEQPPKFVNLDMEEYRDLALTVASFKRVLSEPEFASLNAGIVLQAYLPDVHDVLRELIDWTAARHDQTGATIKVRIVKGANLAMERVEAELHGWAAAPYATKELVDASYKRLVEAALHAHPGLRVGIASHNLFDIAWAYLIARDTKLEEMVDFEMLEGMAEGEALAISAAVGRVLLYTPITARDDFSSAVSYLVRRLDENTAPENYLRASFSMRPDSPEFFAQAERFAESVRGRHLVSTERIRVPLARRAADSFSNEPDADPTLPEVREETAKMLAACVTETHPIVPVVVGGKFRTTGPYANGFSPNQPDVVRYRTVLPTVDDITCAIQTARSALDTWTGLGAAERALLLNRCADQMHTDRFETIATMMVDAGKTFAEADPEVSEAIDFARYYAAQAVRLEAETSASAAPLGIVVVAPPWNFPYAIAAGGILAALAAGNAVILKPSPNVTLTSWVLVQQLWNAGISQEILQFAPCADDSVGQALVSHSEVDGLILTGAWETAELFLSWRSDLQIFAETSGKNAMVITATADLDAAVKDLVRSAFGHAGQKCSAASLAIVEADVYDSESFQRQLADAVASLSVGPSWDPSTTMGPIIEPAQGKLLRALTSLDEGESWLVQPTQDASCPQLWTPGVKLGVRPGSWSHQTEWFGPVLGVMRAPDLATAIAWQNGTQFGLTAGIHSLDSAEIEQWIEGVEAGNLYVNRPTTGAIVERQPFGGWKLSAFGPNAKAGGPNYLCALQTWTDPVANEPTDTSIHRANIVASWNRWWDNEFGSAHDRAGLSCERNVSRYRAHGCVVVRTDGSTTQTQRSLIAEIAQIAGTSFDWSYAEEETESELLARLGAHASNTSPTEAVRIRALCPVSGDFRREVAQRGIVIDHSAFVTDGRIELLRWVKEQCVTITNHRYGNIGAAPCPPVPGTPSGYSERNRRTRATSASLTS